MIFDRVGIVSWVGYGKRLETMVSELKRIGITPKDSYFDIQVQFGNPFEYHCVKHIDCVDAFKKWPYTFDCTMGHYACLKRAQYFNSKNLLMIEDDCRFLKDSELASKMLDSIPDDYSLALAECWPVMKRDILYADRYRNLSDEEISVWHKRTKPTSTGCWREFCGYVYNGASCYAVSADGRDRLIRLYERALGFGDWKNRELRVCDGWFSEKYMKPQRKCYFSFPTVGIQQNTSETVTKKGFDTRKRYQVMGIDTSLYSEI